MFQGLNPPAARRLVRLRDSEPADRPRDAQPACAAGLLARREPEPERDLPRVLHRRDRARDRPGPAGVAAQADGQSPEAPRGARTPWPSAPAGTSRAPTGVYRGLAQTMGFGSYVAACAEVSVSDDGKLKIHRIVAATDPGHAVNPQQIEAQVEGSFAYGLSAALYGGMHGEGRPHRAGQLRHLPGAADGRDAGGRDDRDAVGRLLGRRRRADDRGRGAGGAERHLRRHRQAHPRPAAEEPQPGRETRMTRTSIRAYRARANAQAEFNRRRCRPAR